MTSKTTSNSVLYAGLLGLGGALIVGVGELLLHFTFQGGITDMTQYAFFEDVSSRRLMLGHYIAVLGAPLYLFGYWHLCKMLEPAGQRLAYLVFFLGAYSFMIGAVWIGQRSFLGETVHAISDGEATASLLQTFSGLNEPLVNVLRTSILMISLIWVFQILRGRTHYPKWMSVVAPIFLLAAIFIFSLSWKTAEIYLLPAAMNLTHSIVFALSIFIWLRRKKAQSDNRKG